MTNHNLDADLDLDLELEPEDDFYPTDYAWCFGPEEIGGTFYVDLFQKPPNDYKEQNVILKASYSPLVPSNNSFCTVLFVDHKFSIKVGEALFVDGSPHITVENHLTQYDQQLLLDWAALNRETIVNYWNDQENNCTPNVAPIKNFLDYLYGDGIDGKGRDCEICIANNEEHNTGLSIIIRTFPRNTLMTTTEVDIPLTDKHKIPFVEVADNFEPWAKGIWNAPKHNVKAIAIESHEVLYSIDDYVVPEVLKQWLTLNKDPLINYWHRKLYVDESGEEEIWDMWLDHLVPIS